MSNLVLKYEDADVVLSAALKVNESTAALNWMGLEVDCLHTTVEYDKQHLNLRQNTLMHDTPTLCFARRVPPPHTT